MECLGYIQFENLPKSYQILFWGEFGEHHCIDTGLQGTNKTLGYSLDTQVQDGQGVSEYP